MDFDQIAYARLLVQSFKHWTTQEMLPGILALDDAALAKALWQAPFGLVSHGTQPDPIFCYGNARALELFEMSWNEFTAMPSRKSAPPLAETQEDRNRLMAEALKQGYVENYNGIRISKTARRFEIADTILWNVVDSEGIRQGQAALIREVRRLD